MGWGERWKSEENHDFFIWGVAYAGSRGSWGAESAGSAGRNKACVSSLIFGMVSSGCEARACLKSWTASNDSGEISFFSALSFSILWEEL